MFEDIKVGDTVIIDQRWQGSHIVKVSKVTKASFTVDWGNAQISFSKNGGWQRNGDKWTPWHAHEATEDRIREIREAQFRAKLLRRITNYKFEDAPTALLYQVCQIISPKEESGT